jgi:predicted alpha-1,2-mannosidase
MHKIITDLMKSKILLLTVLFINVVVISCTDKRNEPVDYVNPYIGNISHLLVPTYPTVHLPNSMLRFYPNRDNFTSNQVQGFPLNVVSHRSGKVFNLCPIEGDLKEIREINGNIFYSYDNEIVTPYCYSVSLDEPDIDVKFIPAERSGIFSFRFNEDSDPGIILKTMNQGELTFDNNTVTGYDTFDEIKAYLYLEFERKPENIKVRDRDVVSENTSISGNRIAMTANFNNSTSEIKIRFGLSYISTEQAGKNLQNDIPGWDLNEMSEKARAKWNTVLSSIETEGGTENQRSVFYTSLYRCFERMVDITEDGKYFSIWSKKVEPANDTAFYTDDWVWDTHLALHPLQVILNPEKQDEKISSYIRMARQSGWMPTFPTISGDNHAMNGNHSAAVILDSWRKRIRSFNLEEAYDHLKNTILYETKLPWVRDSSTWLDEFYDKKGYFPALRKDEPETCPKVHSFEKRQAVAITLASSYDDWCMAQMAKELGKEEDYKFFIKRSLSYRNLFKNDTGFYHPKDSTGNWIEPFDYRYDGGMGARDYYDENNGWTYIWQPYHAFNDLIEMMGGPDKFENKLDRLFSEGIGKSKWQYYSTMPDATGNVGQFVMGNEPSMHIAYLYNLAGKPWKTQKRVRMLMDTWFRNDLMGVAGDEDGGGLSAFYVFSAMGFYPITPGIPEYQIGSPLFSKVKIRLQNGNIFNVIAKNNSSFNKYIQSAKLNGKELTEPVFTHDDLAEGGTLILEMGSKPIYKWGTQ